MKNGKPFGVLAPSGELDQYKKDFEFWRLKNLVLMAKAKVLVREILMTGKMLRIDRYVAWEHSKMWTLKGFPKQIDATNRIKALDDLLGPALGVDDSVFWSSYVEKIETVESNPYCIIVIKGHEPRGVRDLSKEML